MNDFDGLRAEVLDLIDDAVGATAADLGPDGVDRLLAARERLVEGRFYIVVCGEYKRGKSSLINALLETRDLCPVDVHVATSVVTSIGYADEEKVVVYLGDERTPKEIPRARISDYVTVAGNEGTDKDARWLEIGLPAEQLSQGLYLIDTPGIGGLNVEHTVVTTTFMRNADAVIFVGDATSALKETEVDFLENVVKSPDSLIVVVNKIDAVREPEAVVVESREVVASALGCPAEQLRVLGVSSQRKLDGAERGNAKLLERSGFAELEDALWSEIGGRSGAIQLGMAIGELDWAIGGVREQAQVELLPLREHTDQQRQQLEDELRDAEARRKELHGPKAPWRTAVNDEVKNGLRSAMAVFKKALEGVSHDLEELRAQDLVEPDSQDRKELELVSAIQVAVTDATNGVLESGAKALAQAADRTQLDLAGVDGLDAAVERYSPGDRQGAQASRRRPAETLVETYKAVLLASSAGRSAGRIVGGVIGASIGMLGGDPFAGWDNGSQVGARTFGFVFGVVQLRKKRREDRERRGKDRLSDLQKRIGPELKRAKSVTEASLEAIAAQLQGGIVAEVESRISAEDERVRTMRVRVNEAASLTVPEITDRIDVLEGRLERLDGLARRTAALRARLTLPSAPNSSGANDAGRERGLVAAIGSTDFDDD